ncbi:hypothetical protein [Pseudomonas chlororaphis]|uniref:hypothetical protein n=1 Tax=Pseudomonas chlororaphis TaxID=587753 RepID=UPI0016811C56|nr:hypothetical protein [Pseudomonas chlororaphis]
MKANTLSTEAPTDFGGNFAAKGRELWKTAEQHEISKLQCRQRGKTADLPVF